MNAPVNSTEMIAALNDGFRSSPLADESLGGIVMTSGIWELSFDVRREIYLAVVTFDDFTEDNDPYGEHDFGAFDHPKAGKIFWKIDCFSDNSCQWGSEHPEDRERSYRVLTIMLASEY